MPSTVTAEQSQQSGAFPHPHPSLLPIAPASSQPSPTISPAYWDEQLGTTFTQSFTSIEYNVTAIAQSDADGYGPAYLLNGLSSMDYWYQVGLSYDWPYVSGGYNSGFAMNYEVFDPSGASIFPVSGGGLANINVNPGDTVLLSLYFSGRSVIMLARDWNTGSRASESFSSERAVSFTGLTGNFEQNGFFTGLMTEWYHSTAYNSTEEEVAYSDPNFALSSTWMWADEFNVATNQLLFMNATSLPVILSSDPTQFQAFTYHDASEASSAYEFVTGGGCASTIVGADILGCDGLTPTAIGLTWVESSYQLFDRYDVQQSTTGSDGPWTSVANITDEAQTTDYVDNLIPNATYWWRIIDHDCCGGSTTSNSLEVVQPNIASLHYSPISDTEWRLNWNNNANYTFLTAFYSYQLMQSFNGSSYTVSYFSTSVSGNSTLIDLYPNTEYSFYLVTTDECVSCSNLEMSSSNSSIINFQTPDKLAATVITVSSSADIGQTASFTCDAVGGFSPYGYSWNLGDGTTSELQDVSHNYTSPGQIELTCSVTDNLQDYALGSAPFTVFPDPTADLIAEPNSADIGQTVNFTVQAKNGSGGYSYDWSNLPTGCDPANTATITCVPKTAGIFHIEANVTDSNGFVTPTLSFSFQVYADPTLSAPVVSPTTFDLGQQTTITLSATEGYGTLSYRYTGLPPGCKTTNSTILACTPIITGNYQIIATVTDADGLSVESSPVLIIVNADPTTTIETSSSQVTLSQTITLTASTIAGTGPFSYSYSGLPAGCSTMNSSILSCTPSAIGNYTIELVVTDHTSYTARSSVRLTVVPAKAAAGLPLVEEYSLAGIFVAGVIATVAVSALRLRKRGQTQGAAARQESFRIAKLPTDDS
jgi:hypothetical protein